jgi:hypothetical protein
VRELNGFVNWKEVINVPVKGSANLSDPDIIMSIGVDSFIIVDSATIATFKKPTEDIVGNVSVTGFLTAKISSVERME